ncbi:FliH/SctL family protein [Hydrogenophilus thermoluteolus]|uniref:Flagellar assembly protein FliH n=1 Tax=Hydrogenophilus thermoluteolus TaxID=297 RepID=A0A2Z6DZI6_HYDTE|nr:FliH/SctL family protein [Hydrogenophilus thermoluteolus]BBD77760.1 flagellar assembly protein FliH [Hydrogenophilus thermoluteolus]
MSIERHQASGLYPPLPLPSFDEPERGARSGGNAVAPPSQHPSDATPYSSSLPTASDLEALIESTRKEGFDEGYRAGFAQGKSEGYQAGFKEGHSAGFAQGENEGREAGHQEGYAAGFAEGQEAGKAAAYAEWSPKWEAQTDALTKIVTQLSAATQQLPQQLAEPVTALAIEIARAVVMENLRTQPESVVAVTRQILETELRRPVTVRLHPDDHALVTKNLTPSEAVRFVPDPELAHGSVCVEGDSFLIDGTVASRWRRIVSRLYPTAATWEPSDDRRED